MPAMIASSQIRPPWASTRDLAMKNFISEPNNDRVRAAFGDEKYRRLVALKDKYDPTNLFRNEPEHPPDGQIRPSGSVTSPPPAT
jgi:Berberine and berberine like